MAEREAIYKLRFQVDKSGQQESIRAIDALADEFADLDKNAQQVSKSAQNAVAQLSTFAKGRAEIQATANEAKQLAVSADDAKTALERAADVSADMGRVADEARNAREELNKAADAADNLGGRLDQADERFGVVSRRVGLAGDVQSNLGSIRGLSQTAGLGGTGEAIGVAGELAALTEELPRLKAALASMPDVLKFVSAEIGVGGVGLIGGLAVLGIAFKMLSEQAEENRKVVSGFIDQQREYNTFIGTATKESIDERIAELNRQLEAEKSTLETTRQVRDEFNQKTEEAFGETGVKVLKGIDSVTGKIGIFDEVDEQFKKSKDTISSTEKEIAKLSLAYDDQQVIARTLAEEEKRLAAERLKNDLEYISFLESRNQRLVAAEELLATGTEEQVQARIDAIKQEQEVNRRNIADVTQGTPIADFLADDTLDSAIRERVQGYQTAISDAQEEVDFLSGTTAGLTKLQSTLTSTLENQGDVVKDRINQIKEEAQSEREFSRFLKSASADSVAARIESLQEEATALRSMLPELQKLAPTSEDAANELRATTDRLGEIDAELRRIGSEGVIAAIQREQAELTAEIIKIEQTRDEKILQIRAQAAAKEAELFQSLQQDLADAVADANESRADALRDYEQKATEISEDLARKRLDIEKKYSRDAANAVGDRDALALYQAKQTREDGLEDAEEAAAEQRADLQQNYAEQLETINRELAKQQQALQTKYAQQLNDLRTATANSINAERQKAAEEIRVRQQAYQDELAQLNSFAQNGAASVQSFATNSLTTLGTFVERAREIMAGLIGSATSVPTTPIPTTPAPTPAPIPIPPIVRPPGSPGGPQQPVAGPSITITGYTAAQIQAELNKVLKAMMPN